MVPIRASLPAPEGRRHRGVSLTRRATFVLPALLLAILPACKPTPPRLPTPFNQPQAGRQTTIEGVVLSVERPRPDDSQTFVHVVISPADRTPIRLVLAPGWYLEEKGIRFEPRDLVQASGRRVVENGEPNIIVQSIRQGDRYLLRNEQDQPVWHAP
jgi:hypothetical protein